MFGYDLGIDLGTTNIVIGVPGKGIRLDEPAYVAYDEEKEKVLYAGKRAYFLEGREPEGLRVERPILSGVVGHYELAQQMMRHFVFLQGAGCSQLLRKHSRTQQAGVGQIPVFSHNALVLKGPHQCCFHQSAEDAEQILVIQGHLQVGGQAV